MIITTQMMIMIFTTQMMIMMITMIMNHDGDGHDDDPLRMCTSVWGFTWGAFSDANKGGKRLQFTINVIGRWGYDNIMISGAGDYNCCEFTLGRLFCNFKALLFGWQHHWQVALVVVYITYMRAIIKMLRRYGWRFLAMIVIKCDSFGIINLYLQYLCCSSYISWGFCC